jgi:2-polyprenyl-3-methyl-5-hydroxy-6-metoxy-1,4-benzoquinol methylase
VINGSFDTLPTNEYDIIFVMGALHHSSNLDLTLKSIFHALKPEGILVAQEPAMPDTTTHHEYQIKYDIIEEIYGLKIRNKDRKDRFFRECEYKNSLILNGFDILKWQNFIIPIYSKNSKIEFLINCLKSSKIYDNIRKFKNKYFNAMSNNQNLLKNNWQEKMQISTINLKPKLFVAKKTNCKEIFHEK